MGGGGGGGGGGAPEFHIIQRVESFNRDDYVRQAATQMELLAKLSERDMNARVACYHEHCIMFQK